MQFYPSASSVPAERVYKMRLLGTGAANPTKQVGQGVTVAWTATGRYTITWVSNPGTFVSMTWGLGAATPGDVKGFTVTRDTHPTTASTYTLEVDLWNASFNLADLATNCYMDLTVTFSELSSLS